MKVIPLKLCPGCGLYNDISVETCQCGADLRAVPGKLFKSSIPPEKRGQIKEDLPVYAQFCTRCGTYNFTADPNRINQKCWDCNASRIGSVTPTLFGKTDEDGDGAEADTAPVPAAPAPEPAAGQSPAPEKPLGAKETTDKPIPRWFPDGPSAAGQSIAFRSVRGDFRATVRPEQAPLHIGAERAWKEYLTDPRVSGDHLTLEYGPDGWTLRDHSTNGTMVDGEMIHGRSARADNTAREDEKKQNWMWRVGMAEKEIKTALGEDIACADTKKLVDGARVRLGISADCPEFIIEIEG